MDATGRQRRRRGLGRQSLASALSERLIGAVRALLALAAPSASDAAGSPPAGTVERAAAVAADAERLRIARDLHDGVLQSLGGAALRIETACRRLPEDPDGAERLLREVQDLLLDEQRELRTFLQGATASRLASPRDASASLADLCARIARTWEMEVELAVTGPGRDLPPALVRELDRVLREALVNSARHGGASRARVTVAAGSDAVTVTVADDGRGFPFCGEYDLEALQRERIGPVVLKQRLLGAGGTMRIVSDDGGATVEMSLPIPGEGA